MPANVVETDPRIPASLMAAALELPEAARASFADALIRSLDGPDDDPEVVRAEWSDELAKRIEDINSGAVKMIDGGEVIRELRELLRARHGI